MKIYFILLLGLGKSFFLKGKGFGFWGQIFTPEKNTTLSSFLQLTTTT